jgi:TPR repeat protein
MTPSTRSKWNFSQKALFLAPSLLLSACAIMPHGAQLADGLDAYEVGQYSRARALLAPLAERGNRRTQFLLGDMYHTGSGVPRDDVRAAYWYRQAADQGLAQAQYQLGIMYLNGQGVPADETAAEEWMQKAADQGHEQAAFLYHQLSDFGVGC